MLNKEFVRKNKILSASVGILLIFSLLLLFFTETSYALILRMSEVVRERFGRYYLYLGIGCVVLLLSLAILPVGRQRLGKKGETPEFSRWSWIAMLYSAGMGAGVLLRAVQEPVYMYVNPPLKTEVPEHIMALEYTFYQWGFTAWAFYGLFALIIGYSILKRDKLPLISSTVSGLPKLGYTLKGLDLLVILTTVAGVVGAVCLGTTQITAGVNHLSGHEYGTNFNAAVVLLIFGLAFISAWQGLNRGIRLVSNVNIGLTLALLAFTLIQGDLLSICSSFFRAVYHYVTDLVPMSLAMGDLDPGEKFLQDWTYYYWAFWISWAPFTGIFIARISKGRTIREFITGVLIVPSIASFFWFTVFGNTAIEQIQKAGKYSGQFSDEFTSIFEFFSYLPLPSLINPLIVILLIGFLVTSADSAIYVLSMFSDKGKFHPNKKHRLVWAVLLAVTGVSLLVLGSVRKDIDVLNILQILLIVTSLPFALLIPLITFYFLSGIRKKDINA